MDEIYAACDWNEKGVYRIAPYFDTIVYRERLDPKTDRFEPQDKDYLDATFSVSNQSSRLALNEGSGGNTAHLKVARAVDPETGTFNDWDDDRSCEYFTLFVTSQLVLENGYLQVCGFSRVSEDYDSPDFNNFIPERWTQHTNFKKRRDPNSNEKPEPVHSDEIVAILDKDGLYQLHGKISAEADNNGQFVVVGSDKKEYKLPRERIAKIFSDETNKEN